MNDQQRWYELNKEEAPSLINEAFNQFWCDVAHDLVSQTVVTYSKATIAFARSIAFEAFINGMCFGQDCLMREELDRYIDDGK